MSLKQRSNLLSLRGKLLYVQFDPSFLLRVLETDSCFRSTLCPDFLERLNSLSRLSVCKKIYWTDLKHGSRYNLFFLDGYLDEKRTRKS